MSVPALYTKHRPIAFGIACDYRIPGSDRDDVRQEALIGLWVAAMNHDPAQSPFPAFARLVIHRRLRTILKAALREKRTADLVPADTVELAGGPEPERVALVRESFNNIINAMDSLSDLEREAVRRMVMDEPGLGERGPSGPSPLANAAARARRKLRAAARVSGSGNPPEETPHDA